MNDLGISELYRQFMHDGLFPKIRHYRNVPEYARKKEQSRNELCNCGSGLKYKKCCGK